MISIRLVSRQETRLFLGKKPETYTGPFPLSLRQIIGVKVFHSHQRLAGSSSPSADRLPFRDFCPGPDICAMALRIIAEV